MAVREHTWMLGGLGCLGLSAFGIYASIMESGTLETPWIVLGGLSAASVVVWTATDHSRISRFLTARSTQHSGAAVLLVVIAGIIAVGLNILANMHDVRVDLTSSERFGISDQTVSVIESLDEDVAVRAFFSGESIEKSAFADLIDGLQAHTTHISLQFIDPVLDPIAADRDEIDSQLGTIILASGSSTQRLDATMDEEAVINAIIRLTSSVEHTICSTDGHGEIDIDDDMNPASISAAVTKLEQQNYTFKRINLMRTGGVPEACKVLLIPDPRVDFLAAERDYLVAHNAAGGQMLVLLDPGHAPGLAIHMAQYGIDVGENLVLENNPNYQIMGGDASNLVVSQGQMTDHPITEPIIGMVLLRVARTVQAFQPPIEGFDVGELLMTSDHAWAETRIDGSTIPKPDPGEDPMGRLGLAAVSVADSGGRVVVFGDSDFTSNELLDQASNYDLLPNTIAWLVGEEDQISIRPNMAARGSFTMSGIQGLIVWLVSIFLIPALTIGGAIATWLARRKR